MAFVTFSVSGEDQLIRAIRKVEGGVEIVAERATQDLETQLRREGAPYSSKLAKPWTVTGTGVSRDVHAPADAWYAHIIAHGSKDHGPRDRKSRTKPNLVFVAKGGNVVVTKQVRGVRATNFDAAATDRTKSHLGDIFRRVIAEGTR